ncbi:hypothetical protein [Streptomyces xanthophaeus]|uniref:hypothetical protein n=1 Tax=Streptomyces xanthophaeus TaxID=67385 RepID=UPI0036666593
MEILPIFCDAKIFAGLGPVRPVGIGKPQGKPFHAPRFNLVVNVAERKVTLDGVPHCGVVPRELCTWGHAGEMGNNGKRKFGATYNNFNPE